MLIGGSLYVQTQYQPAIALSRERTETLYRETVANMRVVRQAAGLHALQLRAQADLARVSHDSSLSGATASLLFMLHGSAATFDTHILEVRPGDAQPSASGESLPATALTIRVRGKFGDILAFIEDLSHHATLISVSDTEMAPAADSEKSAMEPRLDATIHATMYRLILPGGKELHRASAG
ncbi:MAG TPA: hypothetical protein VFN37_12485 [Candidatus Baltobacteraceae bacterium]|nr:hypothetical protein [Candidatus Baltobacteraceae bacterium]